MKSIRSREVRASSLRGCMTWTGLYSSQPFCQANRTLQTTTLRHNPLLLEKSYLSLRSLKDSLFNSSPLLSGPVLSTVAVQNPAQAGRGWRLRTASSYLPSLMSSSADSISLLSFLTCL